MKQCSRCKEYKNYSDFSKNKNTKDGYQKQCTKCRKDCRLAKQNEHNFVGPLLAANKQNHKICSKCKHQRHFNLFGISSKYKDGLRSECNICRKQYREDNIEYISGKQKEYYVENTEKFSTYRKDYYENNKESLLVYAKEYREENKEIIYLKTRQYNIKNSDKIKERNKKYYQENKDKYFAWAKKRKLAKKQRVPLWLTQEDLDQITDIYKQAKELEQFFNSVGINTKFHVDHIIPLRGKLCSGLHVPNNLQILSEEENLRKFNNYDPWLDSPRE